MLINDKRNSGKVTVIKFTSCLYFGTLTKLHWIVQPYLSKNSIAVYNPYSGKSSIEVYNPYSGKNLIEVSILI